MKCPICDCLEVIIMLAVKPDLQLKPINLVRSDFFGRHFLVYDQNFVKLGTVDFRKGCWYFTDIHGETWLGCSRLDALSSWLRSVNDSTYPVFCPPVPFRGVKSILLHPIAEF